MSIFVALVGLGLLIFVHECGHFFVSLVLRMRPRRFYIGFPPAVVKTTPISAEERASTSHHKLRVRR